jgi:hypothetical protein
MQQRAVWTGLRIILQFDRDVVEVARREHRQFVPIAKYLCRRPLVASVGPAVGGVVVKVGEHVVTAPVQSAARVGQFL